VDLDQRKVREILGRSQRPLPVEQRGAAHRHQPLLAELLDMQIGMLSRTEADTDIDAVALKVGVADARGYAGIDLGVSAEEAIKARRQPFCREARGRADHEDVVVPAALEALERRAQALKRALDLGIDQPPGVGEFDRTGPAVKELAPQKVLKPAD